MAEIDSTHTSIQLSSCKVATAVTLHNHIMEYSALVASLQAKQAARNSVSSNARNSEMRIYWFSSEAINLFKPDADADTNICEILKERVEKIDTALKDSSEFCRLIEGNPASKDEIRPNKLKSLIAKLECIRLVTMEAIDRMGSGKAEDTFMRCCEEVVKYVSRFSSDAYPKNPCTVQRWHAEFRTHGKLLMGIHPAKNQIPLLRILLDNPDAAMAIRKFVRKNLDGITAEKVHEYS